MPPNVCATALLHVRALTVQQANAAAVLPENAPMLTVERCGLALTTRSERGAVHVTLGLSHKAKG